VEGGEPPGGVRCCTGGEAGGPGLRTGGVGDGQSAGLGDRQPGGEVEGGWVHLQRAAGHLSNKYVIKSGLRK
jgi:hypothetical protein